MQPGLWRQHVPLALGAQHMPVCPTDHTAASIFTAVHRPEPAGSVSPGAALGHEGQDLEDSLALPWSPPGGGLTRPWPRQSPAGSSVSCSWLTTSNNPFIGFLHFPLTYSLSYQYFLESRPPKPIFIQNPWLGFCFRGNSPIYAINNQFWGGGHEP